MTYAYAYKSSDGTRHEADSAVWEEKNEALRRLGLRTIPNPKEAE